MSGSLCGYEYEEVWMVDFEFSAPPGEVPHVLCMVAREFFTGKTIRLWRDELLQLSGPPFGVGADALFVAYYASAEIGCFLTLGWPIPANILDLFAEFRCLTNGLQLSGGKGLLGALQFCGLPSMDVTEKEEMRDLAMRGGKYTGQEKQALVEYCESDVAALGKLLPVMMNRIDLPRALLRGAYMAAAAKIEHNGVPIDMPMLNKLKALWEPMQDRLIASVGAVYGVYEGRTFKQEKFADYLRQNDIPWPRLPSGMLDLQDDTFGEMAKFYPQLLPLKELRATLSKMRLSKLAVGSDGRNRQMLSAFSATTGRNQPSNAQFIFGPAVWLRGLINPAPGFGIAYVDWSQQEFGIAAALSRDPLMKQAYLSGDPYLEFAKQAGAVPSDATKQTHKLERERFKACVLAVQYGMGAKSLALRIGGSEHEAQYLLDLHRKTYQTFWCWSDAVVDYAMLNSKIHTCLGWQVNVTGESNDRSLRNFPMQANGAEMLRMACIFGVGAGVRICAPVHDALLIEAPLDCLDEHIELIQQSMRQASHVVLDGFELRTDFEKYVYPDRYADERGVGMWGTVQGILRDLTPDKMADVPMTN